MGVECTDDLGQRRQRSEREREMPCQGAAGPALPATGSRQHSLAVGPLAALPHAQKRHTSPQHCPWLDGPQKQK